MAEINKGYIPSYIEFTTQNKQMKDKITHEEWNTLWNRVGSQYNNISDHVGDLHEFLTGGGDINEVLSLEEDSLVQFIESGWVHYGSVEPIVNKEGKFWFQLTEALTPFQGPKPGSEVLNFKGVLQSNNGLQYVTDPMLNDAYTIQSTGHLWIYNGTQFVDMGQFTVGAPGPSGHSVWVRYSAISNPTSAGQMYSSPSSETAYIGTYIGAHPSDNPSDYDWVYVKGPQGYQGQSVYMQFSPDGLSEWTDSVKPGDKYLRKKVTGDTEWSYPVLIRGEDGINAGMINFIFIRSWGLPTLDVHTPDPTVDTDWNHEPYGEFNQGYLWMSKAHIKDGGHLEGPWSGPVKISEQGPAGQERLYVFKVASTIPEAPYSSDWQSSTPNTEPGTWTSIPGEVNAGEYLYMSTNIRKSDGSLMHATWTTPRRMTGTDGKTLVVKYARSKSGAPNKPDHDTDPAQWYLDPSSTGTLDANGILWMTQRYEDVNGESTQGWTDPTALTGDKGSPGQSVQIKGSKDSSAELLDIPSPEIGDGWIISGDLWVYTEGTPDNWVNVGKIQGPKGDPGQSVYVQFSADKINWSSTFQEGHVYMRKSIDNVNWSDPVKVTGGEVSFIFQRNNAKPTINIESDDPTVGTDWADEPDPTQTHDSHGPIWFSKANRTNGKLDQGSTWSEPVKMTEIGPQGEQGEQGIQGPDGPKGEDGNQGPRGPGLLFRGKWEPGKAYYNDEDRRDVVKYNDNYYVYEGVDGGSSALFAQADWDTMYNFDAIATDLLLADHATITKGLIMGEEGSDQSFIRSSTMHDLNDGKGFYFRSDGKFTLGESNGARFEFDGNNFLFVGTLTQQNLDATLKEELKGEPGTDAPTVEINETTGYWELDGVSTGVKAVAEDGHTPTVDIVNGYWHIDGTSTDIKATGEDGHTPTITIDENGMWVIDGEVTTTKAQGEDGITPDPPEVVIIEGYWHIDGESTGIKAIGEDGHTPTVDIVNGYWHIDGESTGIKATGEDGITPDPPEVVIIEGYWHIDGESTGIKAEAPVVEIADGKWLVDGSDTQVKAVPPELTIDPDTKEWLLDGATTGIVAEGQDGEKGEKGDPGDTPTIDPETKEWRIANVASGAYASPHIDATTKKWFVGPDDMGIVAEGQDGEKGDRGLRGYTGAKGDTGDTGPQGPKGEDGEDGSQGPQGPQGPGLVFRGEYKAGVYYNNEYRRDVVIHEGTYYVFNYTDGHQVFSTFHEPFWQQMPYFEMVATDLLLAKDATITRSLTMGELGGGNGIIQSANGLGEGFYIDGNDGSITAEKGKIGPFDINSSYLQSGTGSTYTRILGSGNGIQAAKIISGNGFVTTLEANQIKNTRNGSNIRLALNGSYIETVATTSSASVKENISPINFDNELKILLDNINFKKFDYKYTIENKEDFGFIIDEIESLDVPNIKKYLLEKQRTMYIDTDNKVYYPEYDEVPEGTQKVLFKEYNAKALTKIILMAVEYNNRRLNDLENRIAALEGGSQ